MQKTKPEPESLGNLIKRINLVPLWIELPSLSVTSVDAHNWKDANFRWSPHSKIYDKWTDAARWSLHQVVEDLDNETKITDTRIEKWNAGEKNIKESVEDFQIYIWGDALPKVNPFFESCVPEINIAELWEPTKKAVERYENFEQLRQQFHWIIYFVQRHSSWQQQFEKSKRKKLTKQHQFAVENLSQDKVIDRNFTLPFFGSIEYKIGENGTIIIEKDEFSRALEEEVDVRRIRQCQYCNRVFWAGRIDSFCCPKTCNQKRGNELLPQLPRTDTQRKLERERKRIYRETLKERDEKREKAKKRFP